MTQTREAYKKATKRLFLLDYDGTLVDLKALPIEAEPTTEVLEVIGRLSYDPANTVVIVSGRYHTELADWLEHLPVGFAAEHGLIFKDPGGSWQPLYDIDDSWKPPIQDIMELEVKKLKGSFIEEKTDALVWHYRMATDQIEAEAAAKELQTKLKPFAKQLELRIMAGSKIIEIQPTMISKSMAVGHWLQREKYEFIFAAGDDTTDEDLFQELPKRAYTVKIGPGETGARLRLTAPADLLQLLTSYLA